MRIRKWKAIKEGLKSHRILAPGEITFAKSHFVSARYSGVPFSNSTSAPGRMQSSGVREIYSPRTINALRHFALVPRNWRRLTIGANQPPTRVDHLGEVASQRSF